MASKPSPRVLADGTIKWRVAGRIVPGGTVKSETFSTVEEAERFARLAARVGFAAAREARSASTSSDLEVPTLRTLLDDVLREVASARSRGTAPEYRRMAERTFLVKLGDLPVDAISRDAVVRWVAWQRQQETVRSRRARMRAIDEHREHPDVVVPAPATYSPKSIRNAQALLSQTLDAARSRGYVAENVAMAVPLPSDHARAEMVTLTENEFVLLHAAVDPRYQLLVALLFGTGLRFGEATALTPGDLDLDAPTPLLRVSRAWKKAASGSRGYLGSPKSRLARRTIALPPQLVAPLRDLASGKRADALLFTSPDGMQLTQPHFYERTWKLALARAAAADPPLTKRPRIHDLRHSHASQMIARGMDLLTLQRRLGHESLKTTGDTYGHLMPDALAAGARLSGMALSGALPQIEA
jgi:integrase